MQLTLKKVLTFKNWPVFWKISFMPIMAVGLIMVGMIAYLLPITHNKLTDDKKDNATSIVQMAYKLVAEYDQRAAKGEFSLEEAQKRAKDRIRNMRFGKDEKEYIFINDLDAITILNPAEPDLVGKSMSDLKDTTGKYFISEMIKICKEKGEGFVEYRWPKPSGEKPSLKIAYVKLYKPWGWVIGSGIYADDVMVMVWKMAIGISILIIVVSIVVTTATFIIGGGFISRPIKEYGNLLQNFSSALSGKRGDLTGRINVKFEDEIGSLAHDINKVMDCYGEVVDNMLLSTGRVVSTTKILHENASNMAEGAQKQSSQAERIVAAAEEMSQTISGIARNASTASETAHMAMETANKGKEIAQTAEQTVSTVYTSTAELAGIINQLNDKVAEIGGVVNVIKDIADQTNLLALNAAIEAARAGEQGRGFAVVADEVRKLADRTINATQEITGKISAVQGESANTAKSMHLTADEVTKANESIHEVMGILDAIVDAVMQANDQVVQIASSVEEQSTAAEEVAKNIEDMALISRSTQFMADVVLKGTNKIVAVDEELKASFSGFNTLGSGAALLEVEKSSIRSFMYWVGDIVSGKISVPENSVSDHYNRGFGSWYTTEGRALLGHLASYKNLSTLHAKLLSLAIEAVRAANAGEGRAQSIYSELTSACAKIQADIDDVKKESLSMAVKKYF